MKHRKLVRYVHGKHWRKCRNDSARWAYEVHRAYLRVERYMWTVRPMDPWREYVANDLEVLKWTVTRINLRFHYPQLNKLIL